MTSEPLTRSEIIDLIRRGKRVPDLLAEVDRLRAEVDRVTTERDQADARATATRQMANDANAALRTKLLTALHREDDGHTSLSEYVDAIIARTAPSSSEESR